MHGVGKGNIDGIDGRMLQEAIRRFPGIDGRDAELALELGKPCRVAAGDGDDALPGTQNGG